MGTVFGSFYTLAVYRIPKKIDITHTHSFCPNCHHKLGFFELIPVWSYLFLGGKCKECKQKIRPRYLIIEVLSGIVLCLIAYAAKISIFNLDIKTLVDIAFLVLYLSAIVIIAGIDLEKRKIEKSVIYYALGILVFYIIYLCIVDTPNIYRYIMYLATTLILLSLFSIPVIIEMPFLLQLWLNDVPVYTVVFCRILLLDNLLGIVNFIINLGVYAQGDIKMMSIASGTYKFLCLPVIFLLFHFAFSPESAYWCNLICLVAIVATDFYFLNVQVPQIDVKYILGTLLRSLSLILLSTIGYIYLLSLFPDSLFNRFICFLFYCLILVLSSYYFLLDKAEKRSLILFIHSRK